MHGEIEMNFIHFMKLINGTAKDEMQQTSYENFPQTPPGSQY